MCELRTSPISRSPLRLIGTLGWPEGSFVKIESELYSDVSRVRFHFKAPIFRDADSVKRNHVPKHTRGGAFSNIARKRASPTHRPATEVQATSQTLGIGSSGVEYRAAWDSRGRAMNLLPPRHISRAFLRLVASATFNRSRSIRFKNVRRTRRGTTVGTTLCASATNRFLIQAICCSSAMDHPFLHSSIRNQAGESAAGKRRGDLSHEKKCESPGRHFRIQILSQIQI